MRGRVEISSLEIIQPTNRRMFVSRTILNFVIAEFLGLFAAIPQRYRFFANVGAASRHQLLSDSKFGSPGKPISGVTLARFWPNDWHVIVDDDMPRRSAAADSIFGIEVTAMIGRLMSLFQANRADVLRWGLSATIVLIAHVSVAAAIVGWDDTDESSDPVGAMVVELAPTPVAPQNTPTDIQPGPEMQQAEAAPERKADPTEKHVDKVVKPDVKEQQDIPEQDKPDIALQKKTPEPQPEKPTPSEAQLAAPTTTAPQMSKVEMAAVAAAPLQTQFNLADSNAVPTWKRQVASKLERNKKYPSTAQARNETGVAQLEFSVDRQGHLKSSRIVKSSGSDALDSETLDLVKRAQPFPSPPAAMTGEEVFLVVPIRFNIH